VGILAATGVHIHDISVKDVYEYAWPDSVRRHGTVSCDTPSHYNLPESDDAMYNIRVDGVRSAVAEGGAFYCPTRVKNLRVKNLCAPPGKQAANIKYPEDLVE